ncbi:hypothetical protein IAT38_001009 [Cryptococcus sp. DSM 104549]
MPKPEIELTPIVDFPWTRVAPGVAQQMLAHDPDTGDTTKVVFRDPGHEQFGGPQIHDFWEEVHILHGALLDKGNNTWYKAGAYCCRPPGMIHGPYLACPNEGAKMFVVIRHVKPSNKPDNS